MKDYIHLYNRRTLEYRPKEERQRALVFLGAMGFTLIVGLTLGMALDRAWIDATGGPVLEGEG